MDITQWPERKERIAQIFATKTRDEWCALMEHTDVCFAPVLTLTEAARHPHNVARQTFVEVAGVTQPGPSPRFSRTTAAIERPPSHAGQHTRDVLSDTGFAATDIEKLLETGAVKQA
jgi:alpha-methylacyl-CoA racemase